MYLTADDLRAYGAEVEDSKAEAIIGDVEAEAKQVAPCLGDIDALSTDQIAYVKSVLRRIALRWLDVGSGAVTSSTKMAGPISITESIDSRSRGTRSLQPADIKALVDFCRSVNPDSASKRRAYTVNTAPHRRGNHQPWCSLAFGALYCSCGCDLTAGAYPLYEYGDGGECA